MPKSTSLMLSTSPPTTKMLLGLMSRCTSPRSCAKESAATARRTTRRLSETLSRCRASRAARSSPSSHSIAR